MSRRYPRLRKHARYLQGGLTRPVAAIMADAWAAQIQSKPAAPSGAAGHQAEPEPAPSPEDGAGAGPERGG